MFQRKSDNLWVERIPVPGKDKPVTITAKTKKLLNQKIMNYKTKCEEGLTVDEALDRWLEMKETKITYKTREGYNAPINRIRSAFGSKLAKDITPAQIQAFVNGIAAKGYKRTTVQRPLDILRMLFDFLITMEGSSIRYNPCSGVKLPGGLKQENRDLAPREAIEIIKANVSHPFGLYPFFQMYSGLRDQELLALTDKDIDRKNMTIRIDKALSWQSNKPVIKDTKTENGVRSVVLLSPLAAVIPKFKGYLFSSDGGKSPLTNTEFRNRWNGYCRDVGLAVCEVQEHKSTGKNNRTYKKTIWHNTIVPYQLRHEFATICFDADLDPKDTADLMGHASEETTRKWYTHIQDQRREKSSDKLEKFINAVQ